MKHNQKKLIIIIGIIAFLIITIGITYAYFSANLSGEEDGTTITLTGGKMNIYFDGGNEIIANNIIPDDKAFAIKIFTITGNNTTNVEMGYQITLVVEENSFSEDALKYKLISTNTGQNGNPAKSINELTKLETGSNIIDLGTGYFDVPTIGNKTHTYKLEIYFPNANYNQNIDQDKKIKAYVSINNQELIFDSSKGVNKPILFSGMTPVKWDENNNEIVTTKYDTQWYDYNNKKWANAKTADGSYWVWIPRYAYKITSEYHSNQTGMIDIKFLQDATNTTMDNTLIENNGYISGVKDTSMHYFLHPIFDIPGSELGFWVAKFEPTASEGVGTVTGTCVAGDNVSNKTIKIVPNVTSWRCISIGKAFDAVANMKSNPVYGWNFNEVDTHMMSNLEWGAVSYLSKSVFGANTDEIWNNSFNKFRTGCSGTGVNAANESACITYNTVNGQKASTTHNITGVYDMSGGAWERVSAYVDNGHANLAQGQNILTAKYKEVYSVGSTDDRPKNYEINKNIYGDAFYEISNYGDNNSWFGDASFTPYSSGPWFGRGGYWSHNTNAGLFHYYGSNGTAGVNSSFRVVISQQI